MRNGNFSVQRPYITLFALSWLFLMGLWHMFAETSRRGSQLRRSRGLRSQRQPRRRRRLPRIQMPPNDHRQLSLSSCKNDIRVMIGFLDVCWLSVGMFMFCHVWYARLIPLWWLWWIETNSDRPSRRSILTSRVSLWLVFISFFMCLKLWGIVFSRWFCIWSYQTGTYRIISLTVQVGKAGGEKWKEMSEAVSSIPRTI
jgi:hypothetical protein